VSGIGRVDTGDNRWYVDPDNPDLRYESVTHIIGASNPKPWLVAWGAKLAAEFAVEKHDRLGGVIADFGVPAAIDLVKGEAKRRRELKAEIGSYQHDVIECLVLDRPLPSIPDHLYGVEVDGEVVDLDVISDGFLNFVADHSPVFHLAEATVANTFEGYAGTLDLVLDLPGESEGGRRWLIDAKTGVVLEPTMRAQLAAYRYADEVWLDQLGNKAPMVPVDRCGVLHIRKEYERGYKLISVRAGQDEFSWFQAMTRAYHMGVDMGHKLEGRVHYPPLPDGSQPPPLLEDTELRCRSALVKAGIRDLAALAALTPAGWRQVKGVGPKAVDEIAALLIEHGLLRAEVA